MESELRVLARLEVVSEVGEWNRNSGCWRGWKLLARLESGIGIQGVGEVEA